MSDSDSLVKLYHDGMIGVTMGTLPQEGFFALQKDLLRAAMEMVRSGPVPDGDCLIGIIGIMDGDKYGIPPENAVAHLLRAYRAEHPEAGFYLSYLCFGHYPWMPDVYRSKQEGVAVLGELAKAGHVHARYELANFYLLQILDYNSEGKPVPDEWYVRARKHAEAAVEANYSGGYYMTGYMDHYGSGIASPDLDSAVACYGKALETAGQGYFELGIRADAAFNLGSMLFSGESGARDRRKGVELVAEAARLGNWLAREWLEDNEKLIAKDCVMMPQGDLAYDMKLINVDKVMGEDEENEARARMYGEGPAGPGADGGAEEGGRA